MQQIILDETLLIDKIRQFGEDIFDEQQSSQFSYVLSESQYNIQQRLQPFIKSIKNTKSARKKGIKHIYSSIYKKNSPTHSPFKQTKQGQQVYERLSTSRSTAQHQKTINANMRKKIFNMYDQQKKISVSKQKTKKQFENKKFNQIKPKYLQKQPIMKNLSGYIEKKIYGRLKTQNQHIQKRASLSKQETQEKWDNFIRKNKQWDQARQNSLVKARINNKLKINQQLYTRPHRKSPPKMSVQDCMQKLRRQAERLKEKLDHYSFEPKLYESERRKYKLSKSKSKQKDKARKPQIQQIHCPQSPQFAKNKQVYERKQQKFTVINNPRRQFDFMFH